MSGPDIDVADGVLDTITDLLHAATGGLDTLVGALPHPPDAGDATALVADLVAELLRRTGEIATGSGAATALVAQGNTAYRHLEAATTATFTGALPTPET